MKRKWKVGAIALCATVLLTVAFAAAAGSEGDPLVTLGYLKNVFTGQIQTMVGETVSAGLEQNKTEMNNAIQTWDETVSQAVQEALNRPAAEQPASFATVNMNEGQSVAIEVGCEIIVRSGSPVCSVSLLDQTDGVVLAAGKTLQKNHLYYATERGTFSVPTATVTGVVTADPSLSVRAGAGTGYNRLGTLAKDTVVTIVDSSVSGWYMITGGGLSGYVSADYVALNPTTSSGPAGFLIRGTYKTA